MVPIFARSWVLALLACSVWLAACSGPVKPRPTDLPPVVSLLGVKTAWKREVGEVSYPLDLKTTSSEVILATSKGAVVALSADTGAVRGLGDVRAGISSGVGAGAGRIAVGTNTAQVVTFQNGAEIWRQSLSGVLLTPPLVAGGRVFVVTPDRTINAFDGETGKRLWQQQRGADTLVLDQPGVLFPAGDTLVVGLGGRLLGLNPLTGSQKWEVPLAAGRGTNEVERLVDVVAGYSRHGDGVCVRAYASVVACVDLLASKVVWSRAASGFTGLGGNATHVFGTEQNGTVIAWRRSDGEKVWQSEQFKWRDLGAPVVLGSTVVVPDNAGFLHLLSVTDGALLGRVALDGGPLAATPVLAGNTLVAVTQKGGVFAFRPE